jgi:hypothetical protein
MFLIQGGRYLLKEKKAGDKPPPFKPYVNFGQLYSSMRWD